MNPTLFSQRQWLTTLRRFFGLEMNRTRSRIWSHACHPVLEMLEDRLAPSVVTALPQDNSTSGNERAPNLRFRFGRSVYLITASEMATAGVMAGTAFSGIGWDFQTAPGVSGSNQLIVYMENTADTTNTKSTS